MREEVQASEGPETFATLSERIRRSKRENQEDLAKLSRYYAQGLYDDAMDRYCQTDEIKYHDFEDFAAKGGRAGNSGGDEWAEHYARIEVGQPVQLSSHSFSTISSFRLSINSVLPFIDREVAC